MATTEIFTRTIYGGKLQTQLLLGKTPVLEANTTLNEKLGIQAALKPGASDKFAAKYLAIGIGGHRFITGGDGVPYPVTRRHRASDATCFRHIPYVLRRTNNDLTVDERAKYALRREETHNSLQYYAYYLKRVDLSEVDAAMQYTVVDNGVETTQPFVPTASNLNPVQTDLSNTEVIQSSGNYFSASAIVPIVFTEDDVNELKNVAQVLYGTEEMAIISELAYCTGVDRNVSATNVAGQNFTYAEAIGVQIITHISTFYSVGFTNKGFDFTFELGETEPMFAAVDITSGN